MNKKINLLILIVIIILVMILIPLLVKNQEVSHSEDTNHTINNVNILHVTNENFDDEVLKSEGLVLVEFFADWCPYCDDLAITLQEIANENRNIKIVKINADEEIEIANNYAIYSYPTLVFMQGGEEKTRTLGALPKDDILQTVKFLNDIKNN